MFSRRIVLESLRSQWKTSCRTSLPSTNKDILCNGQVLSVRINTADASSGLRWLSGTSNNPSDEVLVSQTKGEESKTAPNNEKVVVEACGDIDDDDEDSDEEEEMFVEAHESFDHNMVEWGGPRRGGRLPEPTRFGDWERKGRCTDF